MFTDTPLQTPIGTSVHPELDLHTTRIDELDLHTTPDHAMAYLHQQGEDNVVSHGTMSVSEGSGQKLFWKGEIGLFITPIVNKPKMLNKS